MSVAAPDRTASSVRTSTSTDTDDSRNGAVDEPGQRGSLTIADRVVEKVASQAVTEVDLATGTPRTVLGKTLLGRTPEPDPDRPARADAHVDGDLVTVAVTLAVQWPAPVRQVADEVRRHLTARIGDLTGLQVAQVDVDVTALVTGRRPAPRVR